MTQVQKGTPDQDVKTAARLMANHLKAAGFDVSHSLALETLAVSFGLNNWRTLKAKLEPLATGAQAAAKPQVLVLDGPRYEVLAQYTDNNQMYGDLVDAECPLEAAIYVQLERLTDAGWITAVQVLEVVERATKERVLSPGFSDELDLVPMPEAVTRVCALARQSLGQPPAGGLIESEVWDKKHQAIAFWEALAQDSVHKTSLQDCLSLDEDELLTRELEGCSLLKTFRGEEVELDVLESLDQVLALASEQSASPGWAKSDPKASGKFHLLQMKQVRELHAGRLTLLFGELEVQEN